MPRRTPRATLASLTLAVALSPLPALAEGGNLDVPITQAEIESGKLRLIAIREAGRRVFSTPFNKHDGHGDGPVNPANPTAPGGRPTLGAVGSFLRMNGLDSQSCLECHSVGSSATIPSRFAVGGAGGGSANAMPGVVAPDVADSEGNGFAAISGRFINPPFVFGAGGVELLGKEMTADLQALRQHALDHPGSEVDLVTKGIRFGSLVCEANGDCDESGIEGIDSDLVVRPFGRKGQFISTRQFDQGAFRFHMGIEPVEVVGEDVDADGDGVANELTVGQMSATSIFMVTLERPRRHRQSRTARRGSRLFGELGCEDCHRPRLLTSGRRLDLSFPEVPNDPSANVYYTVDLSKAGSRFRRAKRGLEVRLFADLKRHDMGPELAETTGSVHDPLFTTARLWGVADTAPYLHDGRALTLTEAILLHGGEALGARQEFEDLLEADREAVVEFLKTLRTPGSVGADLDRFAR